MILHHTPLRQQYRATSKTAPTLIDNVDESTATDESAGPRLTPNYVRRTASGVLWLS